MEEFERKARNFLENEKQFQLGFLLSEASNPRTEHLDRDFEESPAKGLRSIFSCDRALVPFLEKALTSPEFEALCSAVQKRLAGKGRIILSGCGSTGRLSILIEAMWRDVTGGNDRVVALMTGGDLALGRAVENFEDYAEAGAQQVADLNVGPSDLLIGITATGETTSVVGTAMEAARRGASVFMIICVKKESPASRLDRCRELYARPEVTAICMPIGGMAISGSTRMQSSTIETLVVCAALERACGGDPSVFPAGLAALVDSLMGNTASDALGRYVQYEAGVYKKKELIDYLPGKFMLDVLNDTSERPPTFKIPPFAFRDDVNAVQPWAFARDLEHTTEEAWNVCFRRKPRCIEWERSVYEGLGSAVALLAKGTPNLGLKQLYRIPIGKETLPERTGAHRVEIRLEDDGRLILATDQGNFVLPLQIADSRLKVFHHLAVKLVLNTLSSGVMVMMGRVKGNWMTHLDLSNKKLIDRSIRIISALCSVPYEKACFELYRSLEEIGERKDIPAVNYTILRLNGR